MIVTFNSCLITLKILFSQTRPKIRQSSPKVRYHAVVNQLTKHFTWLRIKNCTLQTHDCLSTNVQNVLTNLLLLTNATSCKRYKLTNGVRQYDCEWQIHRDSTKRIGELRCSRQSKFSRLWRNRWRISNQLNGFHYLHFQPIRWQDCGKKNNLALGRRARNLLDHLYGILRGNNFIAPAQNSHRELHFNNRLLSSERRIEMEIIVEIKIQANTLRLLSWYVFKTNHSLDQKFPLCCRPSIYLRILTCVHRIKWVLTLVTVRPTHQTN